MRAFGRLVLVCVLVLGVQGAALADKTKVSLGTATKGGGFEVFGGGAAQVMNETDPTLDVMPVGTKGSRENIPLLEAGKLDTALVASLQDHPRHLFHLRHVRRARRQPGRVVS